MGHFTKSTSRSPFCLKLSHQENLPAGTTVDRFTMSTPLDQRRAPALNHGGSFTVNFASQPNTATKVKVHNKLYHLLRAVTLVEFPAPALNRQAVRQLRQINTIFQDVRQHRDLIGGIRIEVRVAATTLEEAEAIVEREQPHKIKTFLGLVTIEISTENYLQITNQLINEATETLTKNGVTNHSVQRELTRTEKKTLGDFLSASYRLLSQRVQDRPNERKCVVETCKCECLGNTSAASAASSAATYTANTTTWPFNKRHTLPAMPKIQEPNMEEMHKLVNCAQ